MMSDQQRRHDQHRRHRRIVLFIAHFTVHIIRQQAADAAT